MKTWIQKRKTALTEKNAEGYIDTAVLMIIAVVIGALLLAGLYSLFHSTLLPGLAERIQTMFGSGSGGGTPPAGGERILP